MGERPRNACLRIDAVSRITQPGVQEKQKSGCSDLGRLSIGEGLGMRVVLQETLVQLDRTRVSVRRKTVPEVATV